MMTKVIIIICMFCTILTAMDSKKVENTNEKIVQEEEKHEQEEIQEEIQKEIEQENVSKNEENESKDIEEGKGKEVKPSNVQNNTAKQKCDSPIKNKETTQSNQQNLQEKQKKLVDSSCSASENKTITEEITYNNTATQQLISDINKAAKNNKELWDEQGNKLYKIEISKSIMGNNYMCPYRYSMVEGKVLNVFPVKFLVYAVDYKRTGMETQTRYYIGITNL